MLYIVPSELPDNKGGDIFIKSEYDTGFVELELLPESWFMPTETYQGWYVYCKGKTAKNIQVYTIGGTEETIRALISEQYSVDPSVAIETLTNDMFDRYDRRRPPYLPRYTTIDSYEGTIENRFSSWFRDDILLTSTSRTSLHNQLFVDFSVPSKPILEEIEDDFGNDRDFSPTAAIPQLETDEYWGFYVKVEDNFIPDWNINYDHAVILVSWQEETDELDENGQKVLVNMVSSPVPVRIRTNIKGLYNLHSAEMDRLYTNYPEYFIHYEDIDEEDRY